MHALAHDVREVAKSQQVARTIEGNAILVREPFARFYFGANAFETPVFENDVHSSRGHSALYAPDSVNSNTLVHQQNIRCPEDEE